MTEFFENCMDGASHRAVILGGMARSLYLSSTSDPAPSQKLSQGEKKELNVEKSEKKISFSIFGRL